MPRARAGVGCRADTTAIVAMYAPAMLAVGGIILGLALLIAGGAALVRGASEAAARMGISPTIVGLTIVACGTSLPEFAVNVFAAAEGRTQLAFGNIVGSNIANLALVLGASALFTKIQIHGDFVRREIPLLLLATTMTTVLVLDVPLNGRPARLGRSDSILLLFLFGTFVFVTARDFLRMQKPDPLLTDIDANPIVDPHPEGRHCWLFVLAGLALLGIGAQLVVGSSIRFADELGLSTAVVGLYIVAIGTSMPELATSVIAALRDESDLAVGNVVGSNLFNALFVLPVSGLVSPLVVPAGGVGDLVASWLLAASLIPIFFLREAQLDRRVGLVLLLGYVAYAAYRLPTTGG